eukprot:g15923.t1
MNLVMLCLPVVVCLGALFVGVGVVASVVEYLVRIKRDRTLTLHQRLPNRVTKCEVIHFGRTNLKAEYRVNRKISIYASLEFPVIFAFYHYGDHVRAKQRHARELLEAWYSNRNSINKHIELDPV